MRRGTSFITTFGFAHKKKSLRAGYPQAQSASVFEIQSCFLACHLYINKINPCLSEACVFCQVDGHICKLTNQTISLTFVVSIMCCDSQCMLETSERNYDSHGQVRRHLDRGTYLRRPKYEQLNLAPRYTCSKVVVYRRILIKSYT